MTAPPARDAVRQFVESRFRSSLGGRQLGEHDPLFSSGVIDSFGVLELIAFLEDTYRITIDTAQHDLQEFDSLAKIRDLLKRAGAAIP